MAAKDKRRGHGEGAIYKTADGRWRAVADLGWSNGRRDRKYLSARTRAEVVVKLRQEQQRVDAGLPAQSGHALTLGAWLNTYLDTVAAPKLRTSTATTYRSYARNRIIPALGKHRLTKLTPEHLEAFYRDLARAGLKPSSILACHRIISRALKVAMKRGNVARNVATIVDAPSSPRAEVMAPTMEQVQAILTAAKKPIVLIAKDGTEATSAPRNVARWSVALALGLRQGEALGLMWSDIDFDAATLTVRRALQRKPGGGLVFTEPKSRAGRRTIVLPAPLLDALRTHRTAQLEERLVAGPTWQDHDLVFAQANGKPIDPSRDYRNWRGLLVDAKVPHYRLHDARHFAATLLLTEGVPAKVASAVLGHSRIALTLDTYSHVGRELATDAAERVGHALWG